MLYLGARVVGTDASHSMKPTLLLILFAWLPTLLVVTYVPGFSLVAAQHIWVLSREKLRRNFYGKDYENRNR